MHRCSLWIATVFALAVFSGLPGKSPAGEPMEFIRVSSDGWNFETAHSHQRFIPFGGSMVFTCPDGTGAIMNFMTKAVWDPVTLRKVFEGAHAANVNLIKVFIFTLDVVPDPQTNDKVTFKSRTPPMLERLDQLFQIARDTNVYVSLCSAEWGIGWTQWFIGGGNFFGRSPADGPGVDTYAVYRNLWTTIAERYKNEPAIFSYNLAVEFYMPGGNWRANKRDIDPSTGQDKGTWNYMFSDEWGLPHWRAWLAEQYPNIAALNKAWKTSYANFSLIAQPEIVWTGSPAYSMPQGMIADYNSFKEVISYQFLKNQADAIRAVDKGHMITAGQHPHHPAIGWGGSAKYLNGIAPKELDFLDYTTIHTYTDNSYAYGNQSAILAARFAHYPGKPIIAEEIGHLVPDMQDNLDGTIDLVNNLSGHVSGFQLWVLGQTGTDWGPLGLDYKLNAWGTEWRKLAEPGGTVYNLPRERTPGKTTLHLNRLEGMCPIQQTQSYTVLTHWGNYQQPVEFDWPLNPAIAKIRPVPFRTSVPYWHWGQY